VEKGSVLAPAHRHNSQHLPHDQGHEDVEELADGCENLA
jgi:hypothetical protein